MYSSTTIYRNLGALFERTSKLKLILRFFLIVLWKNTHKCYRTYGGVIQKKDEPHIVVVPSLMWVKALDMILDKLRVCGVDFGKVAAISGCAQVMQLYVNDI